MISTYYYKVSHVHHNTAVPGTSRVLWPTNFHIQDPKVMILSAVYYYYYYIVVSDIER